MTIFFSFGFTRRDFFSRPAIDLSTASTRSACSTKVFDLRPARSAASFMIFSRSAPAKPVVSLAISSIFTSLPIFTSFIWTFKMSQRPLKSGLSTSTCLSNLPGLKSAASKTSGLFVAAITMTGDLSASKPSISERS